MLCDQFHMFTVLCGQIIIHQKHGDDQAGDGTDQKYQKHPLFSGRVFFVFGKTDQTVGKYRKCQVPAAASEG